MKRLIIILLAFVINCKQVPKSNDLYSKDIGGYETSDKTPFQLFLDEIREISLPLNHNSFDSLLIKEQSDWDKNMFTFKINLEKLNKNLVMYEAKSFDFESLKKSKKYLVSKFLKANNNSLEDFALEQYLQNSKVEDNIFFGIPILKFDINNVIVIGYLTVLASENDNAFATIRLQTYTNKGEIIISEDRKVRDGLSLIYGFSSEDGVINVFSNINKNGIASRKRVFVSDEKNVKETTYIINEKGFVIKE